LSSLLREGLYSRTLAGSTTTPPLLIVFYQQHSTIDPMWNVRHLGSSAGKRYSPQFVKAAKLLHWNGHFKHGEELLPILMSGKNGIFQTRQANSA